MRFKLTLKNDMLYEFEVIPNDTFKVACDVLYSIANNFIEEDLVYIQTNNGAISFHKSDISTLIGFNN